MCDMKDNRDLAEILRTEEEQDFAAPSLLSLRMTEARLADFDFCSTPPEYA